MHSFWSGSLSFGLVNIPVSVMSATSEQSLGFHMLHKKDLEPIHYKKVCDKGHEVPQNEIVKGFEIKKGEFVVLEKEDFENANVKKTRTIEIVSFTKQEEVGIMYFERPYYLKVGKGADKAYALLRDALKKSGKVAIARFVFRNREDLGIVIPHGDGLILNQIRYQHEIREDELDYPKSKATKAEMDMALSLIESLSDTFKPQDYHDTYREDLMALIKAKAKGRTYKSKDEEPLPTNVVDLMAMLKKSVEGSSSRGATSPRSKTASATSRARGARTRKAAPKKARKKA